MAKQLFEYMEKGDSVYADVTSRSAWNGFNDAGNERLLWWTAWVQNNKVGPSTYYVDVVLWNSDFETISSTKFGPYKQYGKRQVQRTGQFWVPTLMSFEVSTVTFIVTDTAEQAGP
jgi:hypothetical protein